MSNGAEDWKRFLQFDARDKLVSSPGNIFLILKYSRHFIGCFKRDRSTGHIVWSAAPTVTSGFQPPRVGEAVLKHHHILVQHVLLTQYSLTSDRNDVRWAIEAVGRENQDAQVTASLSLQEFAIEAISDECHGRAVKAGWYSDPKTGAPIERNHGEQIALIHSELSEMLEGVRKGEPSEHLPGFTAEEEEAADVLIRLADYLGKRKIGARVALAYTAKLEYNANRADHKPENRAKAGGKSF